MLGQVVIPQVRRDTIGRTTIGRRGLSLSSNKRGRTEKKRGKSKTPRKSKTPKSSKYESNNTRLNRVISKIKGELIYPTTKAAIGVVKKSELFKNIESQINGLYETNNLSVRTILAIPQFNELLKIVKYNLRTQQQNSTLNQIFKKIKHQVDDVTKYKTLITKLNYMLYFKQKKTFKTRYKKGGTSSSSKSNSYRSSSKSSSSESSNSDKTCCICLEEITKRDKYTLNSNNRDLNSEYLFSNNGCGHSFHKECIKNWINKMDFVCPLCRHEYNNNNNDNNDEPSRFSENAGTIVVTLVLCCTIAPSAAIIIGMKLAPFLLPLL